MAAAEVNEAGVRGVSESGVGMGTERKQEVGKAFAAVGGNARAERADGRIGPLDGPCLRPTDEIRPGPA